MKKISFIIGALLLSYTSVHAQKKMQDLVGNWKIAGEHDNGASLEIVDSTTIILNYMGEKKKLSNYKFDFSKSPCWFDFTASDSSSVIQVKSLVQKVGDDVLKWQLFMDEERTPHFTSTRGETFYLKKARQGDPIIAASGNK